MKCKSHNAEKGKGRKLKHTGRRIVTVFLILIFIIGVAGIAGWKLGILPSGNWDAKTVLSAELDQLLSNNGGLHFVSKEGYSISSLQGGKIQEEIMSCVSYTLQKKAVDRNVVVIDVEFTYPNMVSLAENYIMEGNDPNQFAEWIEDHLEDEASYLNTSVSFSMKKKIAGWEITLPSELYEVLSGGMQSYVQEKNVEIYNSMKEGDES